MSSDPEPVPVPIHDILHSSLLALALKESNYSSDGDVERRSGAEIGLVRSAQELSELHQKLLNDQTVTGRQTESDAQDPE